MILFVGVEQLKQAIVRAEAAHAIWEKTIGRRDENWADWYAKFMEHEQNPD